MTRVPAILSLCLLAGCGGVDDTRPWLPGQVPVLPPAPVSEPVAETQSGPAPLYAAPRPRPVAPTALPSAENPPPRYEPPPPEPSAVSRSRLTDGEYRALRGVRQSLDASINELERRSHFDDLTAAESRQLRAMKARQRDVLRRLRGG